MFTKGLLEKKLGRPAKITMISPWAQRCGIAQYTENLVSALHAIGHKVAVIANYPYEDLTHSDEGFVRRLFDIELRTGKKNFDYDKAVGIIEQSDLVHVQGESALYSRDYLPTLQRKTSKPFVITHHSTCFPKFLPNTRFHLAHSEEVLDMLSIPEGKRAVQFMPSPVVDYVSPHPVGDTFLIRSYGLGINNDELVQSVINNINSNRVEGDIKIKFETHYGNHKWIPYSAILKWIQGAHACILYYPPVGASVTSSAAYMSLACGRPLVVSNTGWFSNLSPDYVLFAGSSPDQLKSSLIDLIDNYQEHSMKAQEYADWLSKNKSFIAAATLLDNVYIEVLS